jgi:uncharacterized NAD-dependent epimerase/dehydratase family protein
MLNEKQIERMLRKLKRFETTLEPYIFKKVDEINMAMYQTGRNLNQIPDDSLFSSVSKGETWGGEGNYCWFKGQFKVDKKLKGKTLYIRPDVGGYEAMLWVNGMPFGTFATKIVVTRHGNHYCNMIKQNVEEGEIIDIALEYYAGHYVMGCMPFEENPKNSYIFEYKGIDICVKNEDVTDFLFDLKTFNQMASVLDKNSFVRANIIKTLTEVHRVLYYSPENVDYDVFINSIRKAKEIIKPLYEYKNTSLAPIAAVIGHSHMDTAWLWHIDETIKKCARTYSNQLSLMEQYPEYKFIQSSAYHGKMIKEQMNSAGLKLYTPVISKNNVPLGYEGRLRQIGKPILCIAGTSPKQGKFSLQLQLKKILSKTVRVGLISTEPSGYLVGANAVFPMGYDSTVKLEKGNEYISTVNYVMGMIEDEDVDLIITGLQSQTIPMKLCNQRDMVIFNHYYLLGANPDAVILMVNVFDDFDYIRRTIQYIENIIICDVIALVVFPIQRTFKWNTLGDLSVRYDNNSIEKIKERLKNEFNKNVYILDDEKDMDDLSNRCLTYFVGEE